MLALREKVHDASRLINFLYISLNLLQTLAITALCIYYGVGILDESNDCLELQLRISAFIIIIAFGVGTGLVLLNIHLWFEKQDAIKTVKKYMYAAYQKRDYQQMINAMNSFPEVFSSNGIFEFEEKPFLTFLNCSDFSKVSDFCCVLCLEEIMVNNNDLLITKLHCNHVFHTNCLLGWIKLKFFCPSCKRPCRKELFDKFMASEDVELIRQ